ncbi:MAG: DUF58 domain-containing protein [Lachnospiraceae bacterium]|nr:DUF58 domain-containing protein [Lachnospiraceae bacterium]
MESIVRLIIYALLLGINGLMYYFLHSHFYFMLLVIMIVSPFVSVLMAFILRYFARIDISAAINSTGGEYAKQNDRAYFFVKILNKSPFISLDTLVYLKIKNTFFGTEGYHRISVPIRMFFGNKVEFPIVATLPGIVRISVEKICIKDLMGFVRLNKKVSSEAEITIMPEILGEYTYDRVSLEQGSLESEESSKKGNDFSDVQEIREYIPGDKLMSIHWKLSAKRDILMVKDRASMSDRQLVALVELVKNNSAQLNMILTSAYTLINQIVNDGTTVRLMFWSSDRYEYETTRIDYKSDLDKAFEKMYYEKTYTDMTEGASHMSSVHPEIKSYLLITSDGNNCLMNIRENV